MLAVYKTRHRNIIYTLDKFYSSNNVQLIILQ